jgi:hypothetical protein
MNSKLVTVNSYYVRRTGGFVTTNQIPHRLNQKVPIGVALLHEIALYNSQRAKDNFPVQY